MKKYYRYKVNASEVSDLMGYEKGYSVVTDDNWESFLKILDKSPQYVTENQKQQLRNHVLSVIEDQSPPLSATTRKNVYKHYCYARFGASKVSKGGKTPVQLDKGEVAEPDAISLLSKIDGVEYQKNEKLFQNGYLKGIPDVLLYEGEKIVGIKEIKVPIDLISFFERLDTGEVSDDKWELIAYLDILGLKTGELVYILVDMPERVKNAKLEEAKLRYIGFGYTDEHIAKLLKQLEKSMVYDYIPEECRVVRIEISRKGYYTTQMHKRVKQVRERMAELHEKFEKHLNLGKTEEVSPKSTD